MRRYFWGQVRDVLTRSCPLEAQFSQCLRDHGLYDEAAVFGDPDALAWGLEVLSRGSAITIFDSGYPLRWLQVLGQDAPPCCWISGEMPLGPCVSVVGNRDINKHDRNFGYNLGATIASLNLALITGGAIGSDQAALDGFLESHPPTSPVVIAPCGLSHLKLPRSMTVLSVCAPQEPFSAARAIERNTLIYASSNLTCVVRVKEKSGGTWSGAKEAIRRSLCWLAVRGSQTDQSATTLCRLGAIPFEHANSLSSVLDQAHQSCHARLDHLWGRTA